MFTKKSDKESPLDLIRTSPPPAAPPLPASSRAMALGRAMDKGNSSVIGADLTVIGGHIAFDRSAAR